MKTAVIVCASLIFTISVVLGGWILLPGVPRPASYETINRKTILLFEEVLSESPITYRSGHYTSLMQYSGSFSDILKPGAIILYKTNAGNYGKMKITGYAYYHAWSKAQNYQYCDVPFFEFTTYDDSGSVLVTGGFPIILDSIVRVVDQSPLWGIGPVGPHFLRDLRYANYRERPPDSCFMWFYFDFDTKQTGFFSDYDGIPFTGADVHNVKTETRSRFIPTQGALFAVIYKP
ncbi:MAG TPA: hypothetical protein PLN20_06235 [Thermotogota bacterium]|nr:MAG: hypothetical protein BWX67_02067 [Thermotogota bacterium ADurb.Bin062]HNW47744.1 hypothetical protein [Thermotogota bacterium]HNY82410.1 hypothetical protein [Thermotogota bacterium]HOD92105.1 hypothetical protein [Thermotogota bacterium]HOF23415.1 hypothetical protein [Thermotogota bacterium]